MRTLRVFYGTLSFAIAYLVGSFLWSVLIFDKLYHPTDYVIFFIDFIPFFGKNGFVDGQYGETYASGINPIILYSIWLFFVVGIYLLSIFIYKLFDKLKK